MRALPVLIASLALTASACAPDGQAAAPEATDPGGSSIDATTRSSTGGSVPKSGAGGAGDSPRALTLFSDCSTFLEYVKAEASERVGPYGLDGGSGPWIEGDVVFEGDMAEAPADSTAGSPTAGSAMGDQNGGGGADFTGTNVQEAGVDEPDIVKTDGERILTVSENRLSYIDVTGEPTLTDTIQIPDGWGHELFFQGDRALLFTNGSQWGSPLPVDVVADTDVAATGFAATSAPVGEFAPERYGPATLIIEVDLSNPGDLRIVASMRVEGQYLSARAIDERVRLVITTTPSQLPWVYPQNQNGEDRATETNQQIIEESSLEDWIPSYELAVGDRTTNGPLLSCDRAHRPAEFSGFDMISIVDLDLGAGLGAGLDRSDAVGVLAGGQTVYSSMGRLYVATTRWAGADLTADSPQWRSWNDDYETDIHAFAISSDEPTRYVASGTIDGSLLNQFSLDEHDGFLRAITTDGSPWGGDDRSETHLVVFDERGDRLVPVGEVGGLGQGEQLYSARLMGDVGFAVTFRQVDPFYVLDLSDPTDPRVSGELKIPGFSTYLHPIGDDRVLGIGQNATENGGTTGVKLSLFDVSDPADPREVSVWTLDNAQSPAEWDHRAFQMWGTTAILPVQTWDGDFNGAVLLDVGDTITEIGRVSHLDDRAEPTSDCRVLDAAEVPSDSELWWMISDGYGRVQLCDAAAVGGWGTWYCERIALADLQYWFGNPDDAATTIESLGAAQGDRVEMCWPDGGYQEAIQRSLVIDGALWTTTPATIQANDLDSLAVLSQFPLR
jgi:hypothetical protein